MSYARMGEEARRDVLLTALKHLHYIGQAASEAFNYDGKSDITVRNENGNLFVAECKFRSAPTAFAGAIDQLFRYAGWRDTKHALGLRPREGPDCDPEF